ncbi:MAG: capsule assembly Wzi family protein [Armatimonadota bacterium]|nr:capsule assembly Wzi family protein [Armatimonadota bacterium]
MTNEAREFREQPGLFSKLDAGSYKLMSPKLYFEAGRNYVRYGPGYSGSMILSDNSPAFDMLHFRKDISFGKMIGKILIDQFIASFNDFGARRYLVGRRYEKTLSSQWNLAVNETAKTSKEPNPLILILPNYLYQEIIFNDDDETFNSLYSLDVTYTTRKKEQAYLEFAADHIAMPNIFGGDRFDTPRKIGYLLGVYLPDPLKTGITSLRAEYVFVDPGTYERMHEALPNLAYTRKGLVMGHPVGSNGTALFLRGEHWLNKKTQAIVEYFDRSPRDSGSPNALDFKRLDAYIAYDIRPWASLSARYIRLKDAGTENTIMLGASISY